MSFFTKIRDVVTAPARIAIAVDPLLHKVTTGHFQGGFRGYEARWHEATRIMAADPLAHRLGIKEQTIFNVGRVVGAVVATYFTAGAASGAIAASGVSATEIGEGAMTAYKLAQQVKAMKEAGQATQDQGAPVDTSQFPGAPLPGTAPPQAGGLLTAGALTLLLLL